MNSLSSGPAIVVLKQQVEIFGRNGVSLDSLWRAAGEPVGRDPRSWAVLAEPILDGLRGYLTNLGERRTVVPVASNVIWTWSAASSEPWRTGDLISNSWVARVYADYLDHQPLT